MMNESMAIFLLVALVLAHLAAAWNADEVI
jgi:hypothetical protein